LLKQERKLKSRFTHFWLILVALLGSFPAMAINKCVDASGNVSYQVEPCPAEQKTKTFNIDSAVPDAEVTEQISGEVVPVLVELPGVGEVAVMAYDHWQVSLQEAGSGALLTLENGDVMRIELTYSPRAEPAVVDDGVQKASVRRLAADFVDDSIEQAVKMRRLPTPAGVAILANFTRRDFREAADGKGAFPSTTVGLLEHKKVSIAIKIETFGTDTVAHDDALEVLSSLVVVES
jgi:hypothetical protein